MAAKIDPQLRAPSAVEALANARDHRAAQVQAADWLARGWNPFLKQKASWGGEPTGFERMLDNGQWRAWINEHQTRLGELARAAFPPGPNGKLQGGERFLGRLAESHGGGATPGPLALCLAWGFDPNTLASAAYGQRPSPLLFLASASSAALLLAAGADPSALSADGQSLWERWAERTMSGALRLADLDGIAQANPPNAPKLTSWKTPLGAEAVLRFRSHGVAARMAAAGSSADAFGCGSDAQLSKTLSRIVAGADSGELIDSLAIACGADRIARAACAPCVDAHQTIPGSPAASAMFRGQVKCLGAFERAGLLTLATLPDLVREAQAMADAHGENLGRTTRHEARAHCAGLAWAIGRMGPEHIQFALDAWRDEAFMVGEQSRSLALRLATKGWLPDSGRFSLREVYRDGEGWGTDPHGPAEDFSQFTALIESKLFRKTAKPAKTAKTSPRL